MKWTAGIFVAVVAVAVAVASIVQVPYYVLSPGDVWPTDELISIEGGTSYATEGEVGFTTVNVKPATLLEWVFGSLDDDVLVVEEEVILGDGTEEENRERNLQLMDESKHLAAAVALEHLGYDAVQCAGVVVEVVVPDSPAAAAMERGDEILSIDGEPVTCWLDAVAEIQTRQPGDTVDLELLRWREKEEDPVVIDEETLTLVERPIFDENGVVTGVEPDQAFLGLQAVDRVTFDMPFSIEIDSGEVGGPSAGLALTLAVLDHLTPEDLTGGRLIATTGTITASGTVGPVGGTAQKAIAAERAGADVFLVPSSEFDVAKANAGDMAVYEANTVLEALAVLAATGGEPIVNLTSPILP